MTGFSSGQAAQSISREGRSHITNRWSSRLKFRLELRISSAGNLALWAWSAALLNSILGFPKACSLRQVRFDGRSLAG
jgi:hypothetical protein